MMGTLGRQRTDKGEAVDAALVGKVTRVNKVETVFAWQKTGFIAGKAKEPSRRIEEERVDQCCDAPHFEERDGTDVCLNCGEVRSYLTFERRLDTARDHEGQPLRHAEPVSDNFNGPRTVIAPKKKDGRGRRLSVEAESLYMRLSKRNKRYGSAPRRSYFEADQVRRGILDRVGFRDPRKISWQICGWVARHKVSQGRTLEATTAAAVYVAAVEQGFPVTYAIIVACSHVSEERLRRLVAMYLSKRPAGRGDFPVKLTRDKYFTPNRHIGHICTELGLAPLVAVDAAECAQFLERRYFSGHRPENKAAAAVQATCGDSVSWNDLARVTRVQVASLKAYWEKVAPLLESLGYLHTVSDLDGDFRSSSGIEP